MNTEKEPRQPAVAHTDGAGSGLAADLMAKLAVPAFVLDAQCRVTIWNPACERLTGVPAVRVIGTSEHWRAFYKVQRPCLADLIAQDRLQEIDGFYPGHGSLSAPGDGVYAENWCMLPYDGSRRYLAINASPIVDSDGALLAVLETVRDLTSHKLAQTALQELGSQDGLTGVSNRKTFDEALKLEWRRTMRESQALSLLMIDIDHFRLYNDTCGPVSGDDCLKLIAHAIGSQMHRAGDLVARYGGEEFAVLLPNNSQDSVTSIAQRIQAAIEEMNLPFPVSKAGRVTVSIGAASVASTPIIDSWQLTATAEAALYQAKEGGRNRIVSMLVEPLTVVPSEI